MSWFRKYLVRNNKKIYVILILHISKMNPVDRNRIIILYTDIVLKILLKISIKLEK